MTVPNNKAININEDKFIEILENTFGIVLEKNNFELKIKNSNLYLISNLNLSDLLRFFLDKLEIKRYDISQLNNDILGNIYEKLIPKLDRHLGGQYYTPHFIADLISELTIRSQNDCIFDCSCGSGAFLISAYRKLSEFPENNHLKILNQLTGLDINYFPSYLAAMNLILRDFTSLPKKLNIYNIDFFKIQPGASNVSSFLQLKPKFDVIITNPPYTEAREIGEDDYKQKIREIALDYEGQLSKTIGIHGYFFTHANHFLKEGGRIGFIVNNSFMETMGGLTLCQYFLNNFKINYIIGFSKNVFQDADVKSVILILEKCSKKEIRGKNIVKFIKLNKRFKTKDFINEIKEKTSNYSCSIYNLLTIQQSLLSKENNWMIFLKDLTPLNLFMKIFNQEHFVKLKKYCSVRSCFKGGGYEFFFIKKEDNKKLQIEKKYLENIIHTPKILKKLSIKELDIEKYVLNIENLSKLLKTNTNTKIYVEEWMRKNIELKKGKNKGKIVEGIQNMPTFKGNPNWYKVTQGNIKGELLFQGYIDRDMKCFFNECNAYSAANYVTIKVKNSKYLAIIALILNSTLLHFYFELKGKVMGANALAVANYMIKDLRIPKLEQLSKTKLNYAKLLFENLKEAEFGTTPFIEAQKIADNFVFDLFGVSLDDQVQIKEIIPKLISARLNS